MSDVIEPVAVIVTGVGGGGLGEQILKALRLSKTRYEIIGTDVTSHSMGFDAVDHCYVMPQASHATYIDALMTLCVRHRIKAIFPGSEAELRTIARHRSVFDEIGVFLPVNPIEVIDNCLDKDRTMRILADHGFSVPRTFRIDTISDADVVDVFPVVVKPYQGGGGSADVSLAQNRVELAAVVRSLLAGGRRILAQEYVGTPDAEFTVGVLRSMRGELINSIALKRYLTSALGSRIRMPNRTDRAELGNLLVISSGISQGEIGRFPEICTPCESIAAALGARGPLNVQCRYVDGRVVVFEVNPRFSGTTSVRALVGFNEPDVLIREHVLGDSVPRHFGYGSGIILRGLKESLITRDDVPKATELQ